MITPFQGKDYFDPFMEQWKEKHRKRNQIIDHKCLRKYNRWNKHFSMEAVTINENDEEKLVSYNCLYRYDTHEIKLEYRILTQKWTLVNDHDQSEEEKIQLNKTIDYMNTTPWVDMGHPLDERIQRILESFDKYYSELNQPKENISRSSPVLETQKELAKTSSDDKSLLSNNTRNNQQPNSDNLKKDIIDHGLHRVVPASIRQRHIIERIYLRVEKKRNRFQNIVDLLHGRKPPCMHDLGLHFLSLYDGKFNYPVGYTIIMPFRMRFWCLTIANIQYVDCQYGKPEPRSILILNYKHQSTRVRV